MKPRRTMNNHNKASGFERRLELYLMENFKHAFDTERSECLSRTACSEAHKSQLRVLHADHAGRGERLCLPPLAPQLERQGPRVHRWRARMADQRLLAREHDDPSRKDDTDHPPTQVTSWAIVDYFQRPKPAYYAIARELRPYTVGMTRKEHTTYASDTTAASFEIATVLEVWGTNAALLEKKIVLEVAAFELGSEWKESWTKDAVLAPNAATELFSGPLPGQPVRTKLSDVPRTIVMSARLIDADGTVLARYSNWCARTSLSAPCVLLTAAGQAGAVQVHPLPVQGSARAAHRARRGRRVRRAQREAARQGRRA
jgi:beta-mannosidase